MPNDSTRAPARRTHQIQIRVRDIDQLFNTMDPSPFHEKDLDADAEEFILSWALEYPSRDPVTLTVHVEQPKPDGTTPELLERAVQHYFLHRAELTKLELRRLMRDARTSLLIGLGFLAACLAGGEFLTRADDGTVMRIIREGLTIAGWVAMWRPLQMYLYDWWPVQRRLRIFQKMSRMRVECVSGQTMENR